MREYERLAILGQHPILCCVLDGLLEDGFVEAGYGRKQGTCALGYEKCRGLRDRRGGGL
jgi:hypothetical protein